MVSFDQVTYPSADHALPFRTICGEYRARRAGDLAAAVARRILNVDETPADLQSAWTALDKTLSASEDAYSALAAMKDVLSTVRQEPEETDETFRQRVATGYEESRKAEKQCQICDRPLKQILHDMQATAICLSGGGIRSASLSLGVLQGLARFSRPCDWKLGDKTVMDALDYLSTVSGGGYIGSWLMAWAQRSCYSDAVSQLATSAPTSGDPEPEPIRHLREYTSYLTPKYGFTLDTLTLGAIVGRNMILNWLTLIPAMICLLCLPEFLYLVSYGLPFAMQRDTDWYKPVMWLAVLCVTVASVFAAWRMIWPPYASRFKDSEKQGSTSLELWLFALPLMVGMWLLGEAWAWAAINPILVNKTGLLNQTMPLAELLFLFALIPPVSISLVRLRVLVGNDGKEGPTPFHKHDGSDRIAWRRLIWSLIAPLLVAATAAVLLSVSALYLTTNKHLIVARLDGQVPHFWVKRWFVLAVVPLVWAVLTVASSLLSGLLSNIEREEEREWWARAGGLLFACVLAWVAFNGIAYFADETLKFLWASLLAAVGVGSGYLGSLAGLSAATSSGLKQVKIEQLSKWQQWLSRHNLLPAFASGVALVCITFALAALTREIRHSLYELMGAQHRFTATLHQLLAWLGVDNAVLYGLSLGAVATSIVFLGAATLAVMGNLFVNVNTFSLHGMYRMRLTRAYLGASNFARHPDAFTNFDPADNLYESSMPCSADAPLHIINTALNVVATHNLAWQQRKAESFTFSPVSCGSWRLGYVPTSVYGGSRGVRVGTAMAISGAALNPNMGYNSSPLVTLLMTFFNTRLGWWLPNPAWPALRNWDPEKKKAQNFLRKNGPTLALKPLLDEALGNTDDTYQWIELSDGGHFENLGLYEMVLRRCRSIVVVDADADPDLQFEDLGNAIRKIEIDLGIPITFPGYHHGVPMKKGLAGGNVYCLEGNIGYDCVDEGAQKGKLIIIKPVLNGTEPPDILAYHASHPDFPHESTANQFFNEAQFESYRHLGSWMIHAIALRPDTPAHALDMDGFGTCVDAYRKQGSSPAAPSSPPA